MRQKNSRTFVSLLMIGALMSLPVITLAAKSGHREGDAPLSATSAVKTPLVDTWIGLDGKQHTNAKTDTTSQTSAEPSVAEPAAQPKVQSFVAPAAQAPAAQSAATTTTLGPNLIANPSFETAGPSGWAKGGYGTNDRVLTYPATPAQDGAAAAKVVITTYTNGDAKWYFTDVPVTASSTYQFSDYSISTVASVITARFTMPGGVFTYKDLAFPAASSVYQNNTFQFVVPSGATSITFFHLIKGVGSLTIDNVSLNAVSNNPPPPPPPPPPTCTENWSCTAYSACSASGTQTRTCTDLNSCGTTNSKPATTQSCTPPPPPPPPVTPPPPPPVTPPPPPVSNLIPNGNLENSATAGIPTGWSKDHWGTNTATYAYPVTGPDGSKAAKTTITAYTSGDAKWDFAPISVPAGIYTYTDQYTSNVPTTIDVQFLNSNGTYTYKDIAFPAASSGFTTASADFTVPPGTQNITVFHLIDSVGSLTIDNATLKSKGAPSGIFSTGAVTFRFDDDIDNQYSVAAPKLDAAGFKGVFYIISQQILDNGFAGYMSKANVQSLASRGHEIGAHTRTHAHLTTLTQQQQTDEIQGSRQDLLTWGVGNINSFAYPYGEYNATTLQIVKNASFTNAAATITGFVTPTSDPYQLEYQECHNDTSLATAKSWVDSAATNHTWLILTFHDIKTGGDLYSCTPTTFQGIVDYVKQKGIPVVTNNQGRASMQ